MTEGHLDTGEVALAWSVWGTPGDPAVVLLHGFPQTRALWSAIDSAQRAAYRTAWRQQQVIAGMCADDRATLIADLAHDRADRDRRVTVPALVLWGADGVMGRM
jgi:pimeloyl-ACP methyl ester carboxylesterase